MNYDGLKDMVIRLMANEQVFIKTTGFQNDMTTFKSKDDILTLLIHLGYLGYYEGKVYIPNQEVCSTFADTIEQ